MVQRRRGNGNEGPAAQRAHIPGGRSHATITIRHENGSLSSYGFTADYLRELDSWQFDHAEGPCYDGVTHNAFTVCGDLRSDPRYPSYGERAVAAGIRSQAGLRIFESMRSPSSPGSPATAPERPVHF